MNITNVELVSLSGSDLYQKPQCFIYRFITGKSLGDVGFQKCQVRAFLKSCYIFASDASIKLREVVLVAKLVVKLIVRLLHKTSALCALLHAHL